MSQLSAGSLAQIACLMEATARKPGNVHRFVDFDDASYLDFALSAQAIGPAMDQARVFGVGRSVFAAIEATRRVVSTNTNLGMVLLLAPLAAAYWLGGDLREEISRVLAGLTIEDASWTYRAIRLASPGGLGVSSDQDVAEEPTVTLLEAMRLAADRDLVARQYAQGYGDVFDIALPSLRRQLAAGASLERAIVRVFVEFLSAVPDTLIARKLGREAAEDVSRRAAGALALDDLDLFDRHLRSEGHVRNPGATADLMAAVLFAALAEGTILLPRPSGPGGWS